MRFKIIITTFLLTMILTATSLNTNAQNSTNYLRVAHIVIKSDNLEEYKKALKEGVQTALKKEPGVISMIAVSDKSNPNKITVFENYASMEAYKSHIQTEHFKKYKSTVAEMVVSLELVDVDTIIRGDKVNIVE